jgi:hypothetical protein
MQYVQRIDGSNFRKLEKYTMKDLYSDRYKPKVVLCDNWEGK